MCLRLSVSRYSISGMSFFCGILASNKPALLQQNLLDKVLPYAVSPMSTVIFKLLGTLRMAVDGQSK